MTTHRFAAAILVAAGAVPDGPYRHLTAEDHETLLSLRQAHPDLAVVVDDAAQGIDRVVRGADLLTSTLDLPTPAYLHVPLALDGQGEKLSKRLGAAAVAEGPPAVLLSLALGFLGQSLPPQADRLEPDALLGWATRHWDARRIPCGSGRAAPSLPG